MISLLSTLGGDLNTWTGSPANEPSSPATVFRALHGYQPQPASWILKRGDARFRRRFDHVFADPRLRPTAFTYVHKLRQSGASDHSPAFVEFADRGSAP